MDEGKNKKSKSFNKRKSDSNFNKPPSKKERFYENTSYTHWNTYFSDIDEDIPANINSCIEIMKKWYIDQMPYINNILNSIVQSKVFFIDLSTVCPSKTREILTMLTKFPGSTLRAYSLALHECIANKISISDDSVTLFKISVRVINFTPITPINDLKSQYLGRYTTTRGTVSVVEKVKIVPIQMMFTCKKCSTPQLHTFKSDLFSIPSKCSSSMCTSRLFEPIFNHVRCVEMQKIIIHEHTADSSKSRDKSPGNIMCLLKSDLVDTCSPGDDIIVSGIIKGYDINDDSVSSARVFFTIYIEVNSLTLKHETISDLYKRISSVSLQHIPNDSNTFINQISGQKNIFKHIVSSFCPNIYGNHLLKAALILCLFSGSPSREDSFRRKNAHLIMIGEPGLGKSQLLKGLHNAAPKSVYICGSSSSSAGITVSLNKEPGSNEFSIEPGAVVLANNGVCCIDEFDKIPQFHDALLEVMEQQRVSIAKSGIRCNMQAKTSIIAAANFNNGSYCRTKTLSQNVCFNQALLSRFDLVFLLLDKSNKKYDLKLAEHLLDIRMNKSKPIDSSYFSNPINDLEASLQDCSSIFKDQLTISQIKSLISYSRNNINPVLDYDAKQAIKEYYLTIRHDNHFGDSMRPTVRQLESLIRLTQARARADLRHKANAEDARDVIDIIEKSMCDTQVALQSSQSQRKPGQKSSKLKQLKEFVDILEKLSLSKGDRHFTFDELHSAALTVLISINVDEAIHKLNDECILLKKDAKTYIFKG